MGSMGNQNPWSPYESYRDCSQGICSTYCPQWCYVIFPPPPPFDDDQEDDSNTTFSPLIIAIITILASAFLLVSYYTIVTKYCRRRRSNRNSSNVEMEANRDEIVRDQWQVSVTGLDETLIKSITVCKYVKGDGLIEGTECSVCLNEFQENESLRLLPKCTHAFHLPCIDTWLKTHSNCPLCRSNAAPTSPPRPPPASNSQNSSSLNISALEIQRRNDLVLVVDDRERSHREEVVVSLVIDGPGKEQVRDNSSMENAEIRTDRESDNYFRRSISLGTFSCEGGHRSIADILKTNDDDDELHGEICQSFTGIGSSTKRSVSTGRFVVTHDKGKNSINTN